MATYIKGSAVANATSYELLEKISDTEYNSIAENTEINFEVSALITEEGDHTLVVVAKADGYDPSTYSNEVVYTAGGSGSSGDSGDTGDTGYPDSLNDTAWEDMTYYDIFVTNNRAPNINNNSMTNAFGNITYTDSAGSTKIVSDSTAADNYVPPYSLYVTGTSSQQAKSSTSYIGTTSYFLAANVKVTSYTKGYAGIIFGSQFGACASEVTDGYEVFSYIGDNTATSSSTRTALFIGSASSANLTAYINNPVAIDMSAFTTAPSLEKLTALYKEYTARLIAG